MHQIKKKHTYSELYESSDRNGLVMCLAVILFTVYDVCIYICMCVYVRVPVCAFVRVNVRMRVYITIYIWLMYYQTGELPSSKLDIHEQSQRRVLLS